MALRPPPEPITAMLGTFSCRQTAHLQTQHALSYIMLSRLL